MIQDRLLNRTPHLNFDGTQESCITLGNGSEDDMTMGFCERNASTNAEGNDPGNPDRLSRVTSLGHQSETEQIITGNSIDAEVDRLWTKAPPPAFACPSL